jgi:predicted phosphodiesterase
VTARVAALYDVHGNLPALEAALAAADEAGADLVVVGGDVVLGPMPRECLDVLRSLGPRVRFLRGNCDRLVVDAFAGRLDARLPASVREPIEWTAARLGRDARDFLAALPQTLDMDVDGLGPVLFCHATPRSDDEIFTRLTPDERVRPMLGGVEQRTVVCGHTHMQLDRTVDGIRILNAGSVGMPFAPPGAYWLLLGPGVRMMRTDYHLAAAEARVRATSYPQPDAFLHPMSEDEALRLFEPAST